MLDTILKFALENKRPTGSRAIQELCNLLMAIVPEKSSQDDYGNVWVDLRGEHSATCFMGHLDTVHQEEGTNPVIWEPHRAWTGGVSVLGADDGAGVALLAGLIAAGIPALYLFTQEEECGGGGAQYVVNTFADVFYGIDRIVSFDRKGCHDICGEQWCGKCASRQYVSNLAEKLGMGHHWARGTYTDNSEFQYLVPEIVNISVGYEDCHTPMETLNLDYLHTMYAKCVAMDWEALQTFRDLANDEQEEYHFFSLPVKEWNPDLEVI